MNTLNGSAESDSYGYDFETVDYKNDELVKIYVECCHQRYKDTSFFVLKRRYLKKARTIQNIEEHLI